MFLEIAGVFAVLLISSKVFKKIQMDNQLQLKAAEEERRSKLLDGVSITVFVRESNGTRTDLEHYLEQELIGRGARLLLANQESAMTLVKRGEYSSLNSEAHLALVGTLVIKNGGSKMERVYTEDEHSFNVRKAEWQREMRDWTVYHQPYNTSPRPQLRDRQYKLEAVPCLLYQLSYRVIGRDGAILASGTEEEIPLKDQVSFEAELKNLAKRSVEMLDRKNIWTEIVI